MANIFISYRRDDAGGHAGRLYDRLATSFGKARVFMDLKGISPGQNFTQAINEMLATHVSAYEPLPLAVRYAAEVNGDEMRLTTTDRYGITRGVVKRKQPPPQSRAHNAVNEAGPGARPGP